MKRLDVINAMLAGIAQMTVTDVNSSNPYVIAALDEFNRQNVLFQEAGYWFNTEYNLLLRPNSVNGVIALAETVLKVNTRGVQLNVVQRDGRLYDPLRHSDVFTRDIIADLVMLVDFDYIPLVAQEVVMYRSVIAFFTTRDGTDGKLNEYKQALAMALRKFESQALRKLGVSIRDSRAVREYVGIFAETDGTYLPRTSARQPDDLSWKPGHP